MPTEDRIERNGTLWSKINGLVTMALIYARPVNAQTWNSILDAVRKRFPSVKQLSTVGLSSWLSDATRLPPLLIDARRANEFETSHLRDAVRLDSVKAARAAVRSKSQPIVVYCSVGYRSSALTEKLQRSGLTNVFNLEGSIFAWANEGRPVFRGVTRLDPPKVHPYNQKWGQLLNPQLRSASELKD